MSMFYKRGHYPLLNKQDFRKINVGQGNTGQIYF